MKSGSTILAAVCLPLAAFALGACGSDTDPTTTTGPETPITNPALESTTTRPETPITNPALESTTTRPETPITNPAVESTTASGGGGG